MVKSNEVLETDINYIKEFMKGMNDSVLFELREIKGQTTKMNGRVNNIESWRYKIEGGAVVARFVWGAIGVSVIGAFGHMYQLLYNIDERVAKEVAVQISTLEFNITE